MPIAIAMVSQPSQVKIRGIGLVGKPDAQPILSFVHCGEQCSIILDAASSPFKRGKATASKEVMSSRQPRAT
jgi:hypothetical protein